VHRDLKPSNIFLVANNELGAAPGSRAVKIVDFGVSKLVGSDSDMTATASTLGTPRYMSPEQIRSSKNVDGRSDVWAIGTIFFELLAGRTPFQGESATGVAAAIVTEDPFPLRRIRPDIPEWVEKLIAGSLEKNPDRRIGTAAAFRAALDQGSTWTTPNVPLGAPPPAPAPQPVPTPPPAQLFQQPGVQAQVATQSSWANAEPVIPRTSKAPLVAIFIGVFVVFGGALVLFLFLAAGSKHPTAADTSTASTPSTSAPATPSPPATTPAHTTETTTALGPATSAAPSASATSTEKAATPPPPPPTHDVSTVAPPPTHDAPAVVPPPPPPQPKDCPASRKILVGGKLTCP
jgi:serine/threonine-protein kinase